MKKFNIIVADPCWTFSDKLKMSDVKRGSESQYVTMSDQDIVNLNVSSIAAHDAILALWVPGSKLLTGLECMKSWGFEQKQTWIWVKTVKKPLLKFFKRLLKMELTNTPDINLNNEDILSFGMGRLFRQSHELVLIGTRGKMYSKLKNKSQRSVFFGPVAKHSSKPDGLQDMLDLMFPDINMNKVELFARRQYKNWDCVGLEMPTPEKVEDFIIKNS